MIAAPPPSGSKSTASERHQVCQVEGVHVKRLKIADGDAWVVTRVYIAGCANKRKGPVMYMDGRYNWRQG